jgi:3D (Asp-Asp-Asp) domain-containing protein
MANVLIAQATTNVQAGSVVAVQVEDLVCSLSFVTTSFGDTLPIIPTAARVQAGKVLFQTQVKAHLVRHADGQPAADHPLTIVSSRKTDALSAAPATDANGDLIITLSTREQGDLDLSTTTPGVTLPAFKMSIKEAWYESTFLITGYNVCDEADFSGPLVAGRGLNEQHRSDFLFGARGVPMQGTGRGANGRYIRLQSMAGGWHRNQRGNRDEVANRNGVVFAYSDSVQGAFGEVSANHSIAVDPEVIPRRAAVDIASVGTRHADDRGSAINGYHIDNFLGSGQSVVDTWLHGGVNGTQRRVKFIGY